MSDVTDEDYFGAFISQHGEDVDRIVQSMYMEWMYRAENGLDTVFPYAVYGEDDESEDIPDIEDQPPKEFKVEVVEKVDGAGFILLSMGTCVTDSKVVASFVWRVRNDGTIQIAIKGKGGEPIDEDTLEPCIEVVQNYYENKKIKVNERLRDHFFCMYSGLKK